MVSLRSGLRESKTELKRGEKSSIVIQEKHKLSALWENNTMEQDTAIWLKEKVRELLRIVSELERRFNDRKFSLDGHLLGSIGEVIAERIYNIKLEKASHKLHDGIVDGRNVQIKITQIDTVDVKGIPEYLSVLFLHKETQDVFEVYNGPGSIALEGAKKYSNQEYHISLNTLLDRDDTVCESDRIKETVSIEKWKKGLKN